MNRTVRIYTDGACSNNGRANPSGGWAAILIDDQEGKRLHLADKLTGPVITNNRAELTAVIKSLEALRCPSTVELTTDSEYVTKGASEWLDGWKRRGWKSSSKEPVKNVDLWQRLDALLQKHDVRFHWIRGHSGHPENELADTLARHACEGRAPVREYG